MRVTVHTVGEVEPQAGERTWLLTSLPVGAVVRSARLAVRPFGPTATEVRFDEAGQSRLGPTRQAGVNGLTGWVVIDLHGRREVEAVTGRGGRTATVEIALGGTWIALGENGAPLLPGGRALSVALPVDEGAVSLPVLGCERLKLS